ncbi:hypothetical protein GCK32_006314 [Trichostrongylus colubriformis]|uniref:Uncharacterized protein n=1 Tax=Trichostrongylus colubriformis TaxID=6319 RepID=A0AAN8FCN5_TRICO
MQEDNSSLQLRRHQKSREGDLQTSSGPRTHKWKSYVEEDARPPAPPPSSAHVSREMRGQGINLGRSCVMVRCPKYLATRKEEKHENLGTCGYKPTRINKVVIEDERRKGRKPHRLAEFPISSRIATANSLGVSLQPPLPLSAHPTREELQRHFQFKNALNRKNRRHWQIA